MIENMNGVAIWDDQGGDVPRHESCPYDSYVLNLADHIPRSTYPEIPQSAKNLVQLWCTSSLQFYLFCLRPRKRSGAYHLHACAQIGGLYIGLFFMKSIIIFAHSGPLSSWTKCPASLIILWDCPLAPGTIS